jgi:hypothetical protein
MVEILRAMSATPTLELVVVPLLLLAWMAPAWATTCDQDEDGYERYDLLDNCAPQPGEVDCDDVADQVGPTINPDAVETVGDLLDQNCDGSDGVARAALLDMGESKGWTTSGSVSFDGDALTVGGDSYANLPGKWPQWSGGTHVVVDVDGTNSGTCQIKLENKPSYGNATATVVAAIPAQTGTAVIDLSSNANLFPAPREFTKIGVACDNGAMRKVDWIAVQDAAISFAPASDIEVGWKDIETPGTNWVGPMTTRVDRSQVELWASSNVAGVAHWDLTTGWEVRDGEGTSGLWRYEDRKVWDVAPLLDGTTLILTGGFYGGVVRGGMLESIDSGATWEHVLDSIAADGGLSVCGGGTDWSAGRLMVDVPDDMASNTDERVYIASSGDGAEGIWERDTSGGYCELPATWESTPPTYIGAMEWTRTMEDGKDWLLVGYKGDDDTLSELWACEIPANLECSGSASATCAPVDGLEGIDVHDIEVDPIDPDQAYIADYGRELAGATCTTHDPQILRIAYDDLASEWVYDTATDLPNGLGDVGSGLLTEPSPECA